MCRRRSRGTEVKASSGQHAEQGVDDERTDQAETEKFGNGVGANKFQHAKYTGQPRCQLHADAVLALGRFHRLPRPRRRSYLAFVLLFYEPASLGRRSGWPTNTLPTRRGLCVPARHVRMHPWKSACRKCAGIAAPRSGLDGRLSLWSRLPTAVRAATDGPGRTSLERRRTDAASWICYLSCRSLSRFAPIPGRKRPVRCMYVR